MPRINIVENIVAQQFLRLPPWARVVTYFVSLAVVVYQVLMPKFINGEIRDYSANGYTGSYVVPASEVNIGIKVEGRRIWSPSDEDGDWSLPMLETRVYGDVDLRLEFLDKEGKSANKTLTIPRKLALLENIVIGYDGNTTQKFKIMNKAAEPESMPDDKAGEAVGLSIISPSYAQDMYVQELKGVQERVKQQVIELRQNDDASSGEVIGDDKLNYGDKLYLKRKLEDEYKIKISTDELQKAETSDELAHIVASKRIANNETARYAYYGRFGSSGEWEQRYFKSLTKMATAVPASGDIVEATANVNMRTDYIQYKFLTGWTNAPAVGLIKSGDMLLVEEVKMVAGDYVWIKFYSVR